jgi:hypothetical protein
MKAINAASEHLLKERAMEGSKAESKKVSLGSVLFKTPAAIVGVLISIFPLSFPVFYVIALLLM